MEFLSTRTKTVQTVQNAKIFWSADLRSKKELPLNIIKEKLYFNFEDTNNKAHFKINFLTILDAFNYLISKGVITDMPESVKSDIEAKFGNSNKSYTFQLEEIDSFDYENENKLVAEELEEENEYAEYLKNKSK